MPRRDTEFDLCEALLHRALQALRDASVAELEVEQLRTKVHTHICDALDTIVNYSFVEASDPRATPTTHEARTRSAPRVEKPVKVVQTGLPCGLRIDLDLLK